MRHDATRLHRYAGDAVVLDTQAHDVRGARERGGDVATLHRHAERLIRAELRVDQRSAGLERAPGIRHSGERLVVDLDQLERLARE